MTNEELIQHLERKQLAALLIKEKQYPEYDEGIDGEMHFLCMDIFYVTPDCREFDTYEDALQHTCWWLSKEV